MPNNWNYTVFKYGILLYLQFLSVLCCAQVQETNYTVQYDFVSITDTVTQTFGRTYPFLLINREGVSRFHSEARQYNDSMAVEWYNQHPQHVDPQTLDESINSAKAFLAGSADWRKSNPVDYSIEKNLVTNSGKIGLELSMPPQFFTQSLDFNWTIADQRDTISGLPCRKATINYNGRSWEAWYAPAIPISDGPYIFTNLPGLIVKVRDDRGWFTFTLTGVHLNLTNRFWKEDYFNPQALEIAQQDFVNANIRRIKNPNMQGVIADKSVELLQQIRANSKWKIHLLLEN